MGRFTAKIIKSHCVNTNDFEYLEGQVVKVVELSQFKNSYAIYNSLCGNRILDWIPKENVVIIL